MNRISKLLAFVAAAGLAVALSAGISCQPADAAPAPSAAAVAAPAVDAPAPAVTPASPVAASTVVLAADPAPAAPAAAADTPEPDISGVLKAFQSSKYLAGIAGVLFLIVALIRRTKWSPKSGWAKKVLAGVLSFVATGGLSVWATGSVGLNAVAFAAIAGLVAAGLNDWVKDVKQAAGGSS